jgi:hypothetical protein
MIREMIPNHGENRGCVTSVESIGMCVWTAIGKVRINNWILSGILHLRERERNLPGRAPGWNRMYLLVIFIIMRHHRCLV